MNSGSLFRENLDDILEFCTLNSSTLSGGTSPAGGSYDEKHQDEDEGSGKSISLTIAHVERWSVFAKNLCPSRC